MNGKKAKLLRGLAGGTQDEIRYQRVENTGRIRQAKDAAGEVIGEVTTVTIELAPGARKLYKNLKRGYLSAIRA